MSKTHRDPYWIDAYWGLFFKIVSLILTFINVRLMISYLGKNIYGDWVAISSIVSWMNAGDFGVGNGLRNEISKFYAQKNNRGINSAIYSTNILFCIISIIMFCIIILVGWLMGRFNIISVNYYLPLIIMSLFFSVSLFFGRAQSIALGIQKSWYISLANAISVSISIICYLAISFVGLKPDLMVCAYIYGLTLLLPLFVVIIFLRFFDNIGTRDKQSVFDKEFVRRVLNSGIKFYVLQLTSLVLFSTDNVLVVYFFGSSEVTRYSLINQVYTVGTSIFYILINSFWSGVAIHYEKKEIKWITNNIRKIYIYLLVFSVGVVFVSIVFNKLVFWWIGDATISYNYLIVLVFAVYCLFDCLQSIFGGFNYGIGNIEMIMYLGIFSAIVNIPLSILFAKTLDMGIMGIKLGTLGSLLPSWIIIIFVTYKNIKRLAKYSPNEDQN